jgi:RNA polymerase sigma-70 factor (sigma-E family)
VTFEEFVTARTPALLRYAAVLTGDRHLAQDVVQDVLVRAHGRWRRIAALDHPDQYVRRMVTNEYLSWRRRPANRDTSVTRDGRPPEGAGTVAGPEDGLAERDELWARLAALPRRQRAVLVLRYYEDLSDARIAEVLGCAVGTVRGHASRALATLRLDPESLSLREQR